MVQFYASQISDNIFETPEGYLVCKNVPIAKVGVQEYLGQELGLKDKYDQIVKVYREAEDVFDPDAIASFEGKSFTDEHPFDEVDVNNRSIYEKGHIQNVRPLRDIGLLVSDIIVKDPTPISEIKNKLKRDISSGYNCYYVPFKDGYRQIKIRGNHVALVTKGRAGSRVAIQDKETINIMSKENILAAMFKSFAKDATPEEIKLALEAIGDVNSKDETTTAQAPIATASDEDSEGLLEKIKGLFKKDEKPEEEKSEVEIEVAKDDDRLKQIIDRLEALEERFSSDKDLTTENTLDEETVEEVDNDESVQDESEEVKDEEMTTDSIIQNLKNIRSQITKSHTAKEFAKVTDSITSTIRALTAKDSKKNGYKTIAKAMAQKTSDSAPKDIASLGKEWAEKYNAQLRKGE